MTFTKEELLAEVDFNLQHCFCSNKTKRLMEIALVALTAEPVSQHDELSGTQIKQVADLYSIVVPGGRSVAYSTDAVEASDCRAMGWDVQEFVKLERYQDAIINNPSEIQDGYVLVPVEPTAKMIEATFAGEIELQSVQHQIRNRERRAHYYRAMLAAAPQ